MGEDLVPVGEAIDFNLEVLGTAIPDDVHVLDLLDVRDRGRIEKRANVHVHPAVRQAVMDRDCRRCRYCGRGAAEIDHVIPLAQGGSDELRNLVASCRSCNRRKGGGLFWARRLQLRCLAEHLLLIGREDLLPEAVRVAAVRTMARQEARPDGQGLFGSQAFRRRPV